MPFFKDDEIYESFICPSFKRDKSLQQHIGSHLLQGKATGGKLFLPGENVVYLFNAYYSIGGMVIYPQDTNYFIRGMTIDTQDTNYSIGGMVINTQNTNYLLGRQLGH